MNFIARLPRMRGLLTGGALLLVAMSAPSLSQAQPRANIPSATEIAAQLELTADQETVFVRIVEDHIARTRALLQKHGVDPSKGRPSRQTMRALRGEMEQNRKAVETELAAILTQEQFDKFKDMQPKRRRQ